jgi:murein L,D-transpeptidase YafK
LTATGRKATIVRPEGLYVLDARNAPSHFYKAFHISYPNSQDIIAPKKPVLVLVMTSCFTDYQVVMRGWLKHLSDWTNGCIAVTNEEMDEIWRVVLCCCAHRYADRD